MISKSVKSLSRFCIFCFLIFLVCATLLSCSTRPCPLYGSWISYTGDELTLSPDGTFKAKIDIFGRSEELEGTFNHRVVKVLQFESNGIKFNAIWTIDAGLLQLQWPTDTNGNTMPLEMYRKEAA